MIRLLFCLVMLVAVSPASSQDYPTRAITIVLPFQAGTGTDTILRIIAQKLNEKFQVPVIVENRAGANGSIAAAQVARAAPDGYTLMMTTNTTHASNPSLMKSLPYDPVADFSPITRLGNLPFIMVVNPAVPARTVKEFAEYTRANPGKLSYGSGNSTGIVAGAAFRQMAGVEMTHIPYKSTPGAITDVMAGRVTMMFIDFAAGIPHIRSGALRALAVTTPQRSPLLPDLPTLAEAGFKDLELMAWVAMFGPRGMPAPVIAKLNRALAEVIASPALKARFDDLGFEAFTSTPEELGSFVKEQIVHWGRMIAIAGVEKE